MTKVWMDGINGPAMDKFMEDLRSGKYSQTRGELFNQYGFCCLGVATDGAAEALGLTKGDTDTYDHGFYKNGERFSGMMPRMVAEYLGIPEKHLDNDNCSTTNVYLRASNEEVTKELHDWWVTEILGFPALTAVMLNDSLGKSFAEIADRFEETFKVDKEG